MSTVRYSYEFKKKCVLLLLKILKLYDNLLTTIKQYLRSKNVD